MSNVAGNINQTKVILYAETSTNVFELVGGQLSHNHSQSLSPVNITNKSLGAAKILLSGAGPIDNSLSGEVLFSTDSVYQFMVAAFNSRTFVNMLIKEDLSPLVAGDKIPYLITNIGKGAAQNGAFKASLSLQGVNISVNGAPPANIPPVANFSFITNIFIATFTDQSTDLDGTIAAWLWEFGDLLASTSTLENPVFDYGLAGTFNVTLTVTDNDGAQDTIIKPVTVSAANIPPVANFTFVTNGLEVTFTDTSTDADGTITAWLWDFGD